MQQKRKVPSTDYNNNNEDMNSLKISTVESETFFELFFFNSLRLFTCGKLSYYRGEREKVKINSEFHHFEDDKYRQNGGHFEHNDRTYPKRIGNSDLMATVRNYITATLYKVVFFSSNVWNLMLYYRRVNSCYVLWNSYVRYQWDPSDIQAVVKYMHTFKELPE